MSPTATLLVTAAALGAVHTLAPDHWLPFAVLGKARSLPAAKTARMAFEAGILHLLATAIFSVAALFLGATLLENLGLRLESLSLTLLFASGLFYAGYSVARRLGGSLTGSDEKRLTHLGKRGLYTLFALDPCVPLMPILILAAPFGATTALAVFTAYSLTTLATMTTLTWSTAQGLHQLRVPASMSRWLDATAGAAVASTAILMAVFG